ncbi:MAG: hypothetical protein JWQ43_3297 [Glaciihabitans sp.]|nr:hypothetical protein [Glaciihabitans sp.]
MHPVRTSTDPVNNERGSASLELITTGLILLVPLIYLVVALSAIQAGAFAVEGAARQAARVFVQGDSEQDAFDSAQRAVEFALADYGLDSSSALIEIRCDPEPTECLARRGYVTVMVSTTIPLPLVPTVVGSASPASIPLDAAATQRVSRFWSGR